MTRRQEATDAAVKSAATFASHDQLLAAAKEVVCAFHSSIVGHPCDFDGAVKQLEIAIIMAEECGP